jgi:hypothetical protein
MAKCKMGRPSMKEIKQRKQGVKKMHNENAGNNEQNNNHIDNATQDVDNEIKDKGTAPKTDDNGNAPESELQIVTATNTATTAKPPKKIDTILKPLAFGDDEADLIAKINNDISHIKPAGTRQRMQVFWKGQDIRKAEVQASCPFRFTWLQKSSGNETKSVKNLPVVSKKEFTLGNGACLVSTGSDDTPALDIFSVENYVLCFLSNKEWLKDRQKRSIIANRQAEDKLKQTKEKHKQAIANLENGNIDQALASLSTAELVRMAEEGTDINPKDLKRSVKL